MRVQMLIVMCVLTLLASVSAYAQVFTTDIPFQFTAGERALPAGSYTFSRTEDRFTRLEISDAKGGRVIVNVIARLAGPTPFADCSIIFDVSGNDRAVSEVWIPGAGGFLIRNVPTGHTSQLLIGVPPGSAKLDGKRAFAQTCAKCHGPEGKGNPDADKFFKVTIPRLGSEYVQAKSDQEIREIITQGRRNMDPVRIGGPGLRHLLQTQSVDEIIAYIRTLKR